MRSRSRNVFKAWSLDHMLQTTPQRGARAVVRQFNDSTLDKIWGLKPTYLPVVIRRRKVVS